MVQTERRLVVARGLREVETKNNCYWLRGFPFGLVKILWDRYR